MKKKIIYTNADNEDFTVDPYLWNGKTHICLDIIGGGHQLYFESQKEVQDFCEILTSVTKITFEGTK